LREPEGNGNMPQTFPRERGLLRTGDIDQTIELGAGEPCQLHIVLLDETQKTA
jgi:hypothetical protein